MLHGHDAVARRAHCGAGLVRYVGFAIALVVVSAVVAVLGARRIQDPVARRRHWLAVAITLAVVALLTAVFDNVMIRAGLFWYEPSATSGLRIGVAPVEDFSYAIACCLALPGLWLLFGSKRTAVNGG